MAEIFKLFKDVVLHLEKGATILIKTIPLFDNDRAQKEAINEERLFSVERDKIKGEREKLKTLNVLNSEEHVKEVIKKRVEWSFDNVPKTQEVNDNRIMMNAISSAKLIESIDTNKATKINKEPVIADANPVINDLQKQIKCIECSIKKLELNLKLTNEDGINDGELLTLLQEISDLCRKKDDVGCDEDSKLQEFVDEVILKRDMNSISGLIKLASFMCPILAFANKNLVSNLGTKAIVEDKEAIKNATSICCKIIGYVAETGSDYDGTDQKTLFDTTGEIVGIIGASHEVGVIEGVVSFVGLGATKEDTMDNKIKSSIRSVVRTTISNTINKVFKTATKYQQFICMVFITLLSTHILLTMSISGGSAAEGYYSSVIENAYNTTLSIGNGTMTFGNETMTTGGKRASKSRRAANAAKPRATRAAKATKAVSKAIAKAVAKPTKTPPKPTAKAAAKAAPKKKK